MNETVLLLFEYDDFIAVYEDSNAGRTAAEADQAHLHAEAEAVWATGNYRVTREYRPPKTRIVRAEIRVAPRYGMAAAPDGPALVTRATARDALRALLWELPSEFAHADPDRYEPLPQFSVIKKSNVRKVHRALYTLRRYFGVNIDNDSGGDEGVP